MRFQYYFLLVFFSLSAQNNPLEIKIDSITSKDSSEFLDREFTISYTIENLTNKEVAFFLNTNNFMASTFSSMQYVATYRLFQNENQIDASQIIKGKRIYFQSDINKRKAFKESLKNKSRFHQIRNPKNEIRFIIFLEKEK
jgi:hypothetical protein